MTEIRGILIAVYIDSLVMISIEKSETNKKKSTGNPRQICLGPWPMLSLWQKSGTNFMVRDKFINPLNLGRVFKFVSDHEFCHGF